MSETTPVVVVGASGFGRECLDVLDAMRSAGSSFDVLGVLDDSPSDINLARLRQRDVKYIGTIDEWLTSSPSGAKYVLGIGHPDVRRRLVARFDQAGIEAFTAIHPAALIGASFSAGDGAVICGGVSVGTNVRLGRHVHLNPNSTIGHDALLYDFVSVNPAAIISGEVQIHPGTLIGAGATVLQMLSIGKGAIIGAGAVATKSVPGGTTAKGVPARWTEQAT